MLHNEATEMPQAGDIPPVSGVRVLQGAALGGVALWAGERSRPVTFRLLEEVGRGGMGVVYRAEQVYPQRIIALKVMKGELADAAGRRRFEREIELLGRLKHWGIAQLYFAGLVSETQRSVPFLAMEFVEGMPLAGYAREQKQKLGLEARVRLFVKICEVVGYAHRQGVVHRDLKPSNILVDGAGEPKILDFGLAAGMGMVDTHSTQLTMPGQLVGTLDYMSPEQADCRTEEIDERSDLYSLGVMLYELLAERRPFELTRHSLVEAVRTIKEDAPPPLSGVSRALRGDLETMVHKALQKERAARYGSVDELADDLRRWLRHEPIAARRPSVAYQTSRFVRRNRAFVAAAGMIIAALSVGLLAAARQAAMARAAERHAEGQLVDATLARADDALHLARFPDAWKLFNDAWDLAEKLGEPTTRMQLGMAALDVRCARKVRDLPHWEGMESYAVSGTRGWVAIGRYGGGLEVRNVLTDSLQMGAQYKGRYVQHLEFSQDGLLLMVMGDEEDGRYMDVWRVTTGKRIYRRQISFSAPRDLGNNDQYIEFKLGNNAVACSRRDGLSTFVELEKLEGSEGPKALLAWPSGGRMLKFVGPDLYVMDELNHTLLRFEKPTGAPVKMGTVPGEQFDEYHLSEDGKHLLQGSAGTLRMYDTATMKETCHMTANGLASQTGVTDEFFYTTSGRGAGTVDYYDFGGQLVRSVPMVDGSEVVTSKDLVVVETLGRIGSLWTLNMTREYWRLPVERREYLATAFSSDGAMAALATNGDEVLLVDMFMGNVLGKIHVDAPGWEVFFNEDATELAVINKNRTAQIWSIPQLQKIVETTGFNYGLDSAAFASNGDVMAWRGGDKQTVLWRRVGNQWKRTEFASKYGAEIAISPDSSQLTLFDSDDGCERWDMRGPAPVRIADRQVIPTARPPGWTVLSAVHSNNGVSIWDTTVGVRKLTTGQRSSAASSSSPSGTGVVLYNKSVSFWDLEKTEVVGEMTIPSSGFMKVAVNRDGHKVLLYDRMESRFLDTTVPGELRELAGGGQEGMPADPVRRARWMAGVGMMQWARPLYVSHRAEILGEPRLSDVPAFWEVGDVEAVRTIIKAARELKESTRTLILQSLEGKTNR